MLLSLLQRPKINLFVLKALRTTDYGHCRNAGVVFNVLQTVPESHLYRSVVVGYCAMIMCGTMMCQSTYRYVEDRRRCVPGVRCEGGLA
jgi:hypothetical protein